MGALAVLSGLCVQAALMVYRLVRKREHNWFFAALLVIFLFKIYQ